MINAQRSVFLKYLKTICVLAPGFSTAHNEKTWLTQLQLPYITKSEKGKVDSHMEVKLKVNVSEEIWLIRK